LTEVTVRSDRGLSQEIVAAAHRLVSDEPPPAGGDAGPSPRQLLCAALGACTAMTIRLYAARKAWPLEALAVRVRYEAARPGGPGPEARGGDERFDLTIELGGALDDAQRARLLEIAAKCPVHRTLRGQPLVVATLGSA